MKRAQTLVEAAHNSIGLDGGGMRPHGNADAPGGL